MHNYSHDALLEVATEGVGLMVLDLPVLHGAAPQVVIQLCSVDGCTALLVVGGVLPDPEVDVLGQETARSPGLGCSQRDQVRGQRASLCCWPLWPGENVAYSGLFATPGRLWASLPAAAPVVDLLCGSSSGSPIPPPFGKN